MFRLFTYLELIFKFIILDEYGRYLLNIHKVIL